MSQNFAFSAYAPRVSANVAYTATHSGATALPTGCTRVAVKSATDAYILFGGSGVATVTSTNGWYLTALQAEVFDLPTGCTYFDVVRVSADGSLFYTSVSQPVGVRGLGAPMRRSLGWGGGVSQPTYIVGPFSDANYFASANGLAPTWATFTWSAVFKLITFTAANNESILCTVDSTQTKAYRAYINTNGLQIVLVTSGGSLNSPAFALSSADNGKTIVAHWTYDGTTVRQYVNGAEVGTGTSAPGLFVPDANSPLCIGRYPWSTGLSAQGEAVACIRGTSTVLTPLQIANDAAAIMARTANLVFPTLPGESVRYVAADLVTATDWHDRDGDNLTLTKHGSPTVALL